MAVSTDIIVKIQKLLAQANDQSVTEAEAAAFAGKAQDLMRKYDLEMAEVQSVKAGSKVTGVERGDKRAIREQGKPGAWKLDLFETVARTSDCWVYRVAIKTGKTKVNKTYGWDDDVYADGAYLIGRTTDVQMANYIFDFLVHELERLAQEYADRMWADIKDMEADYGSHQSAERAYTRQTGTHPLKAKRSWLEGAAKGTAIALNKARNERNADPTSMALVVNKEEAIRDWWAQQRGYTGWDAYQAEMKAKATANPYAVDKPETDAQRRTRERREAAAAEKAWRRKQAAYEREVRRTDFGAYQDGYDRGKAMQVNPGVGAGQSNKEIGNG